MDTVYKYCRARGLKILRDLELKVTRPNQFNDPFEFTPKIVCSDPVGYAKRLLDSEPALERLYEKQKSEGRFRGSFQNYQELAKKYRAEMIKELVRVGPLACAQIEKEFLDEVSKRKAVLCMSGRRDSMLMWGHYCDQKLGLVIGFDKSSAIFQKEKGLRRVDYVKERIVFDSWWEFGSPEMEIYEVRIIVSKGGDWKYEDEFRQIFTFSSSSLVGKPPEDVDKDKTPGYFLPFPPEAIVSVTLGPRCSSELENGVVEMLKKPHFIKYLIEATTANIGIQIRVE